MVSTNNEEFKNDVKQLRSLMFVISLNKKEVDWKGNLSTIERNRQE